MKIKGQYSHLQQHNAQGKKENKIIKELGERNNNIKNKLSRERNSLKCNQNYQITELGTKVTAKFKLFGAAELANK